MKKILIVTELYPFPGNVYLGTFVVQQIQALKKDFDITVLTVYPKSLRLKNKRPKYFRQENGIQVYSLPYYPLWIHGLGLLNIPFSIRIYLNKIITKQRLYREAKRLHRVHQFDLVHGHETYIGDEAGPIGKILGIPSVFTLHSFYFYHEKIFGKYSVRRALKNIRLTDKCIAVSSIAAESYVKEGIERSKFAIIPNGINVPKKTLPNQSILKFSKGRKVILSVGSLINEKRFNISIATLAQFRSEEAVLVIAGSGEAKKELTALAVKLGCESRILWLGTVNPLDMPAVYQTSNIVLHPSVVDSFSMVCLEAMSYGKVVVCTTLIGICEFATNGMNILCIPPDNVEQAYRVVHQLLENNSENQRIGQNAIAFSTTMTWEQKAEKITATYRKLIRNARTKT